MWVEVSAEDEVAEFCTLCEEVVNPPGLGCVTKYAATAATIIMITNIAATTIVLIARLRDSNFDFGLALKSGFHLSLVENFSFYFLQVANFLFVITENFDF